MALIAKPTSAGISRRLMPSQADILGASYAYYNPDLVYYNHLIPPGSRLVGVEPGQGPPCARYEGRGEVDQVDALSFHFVCA